jgi:hypothetical protein
MHTVRRDGGHVGGIEFRNIVIGTHTAIARHGVCVGGGRTRGDRCISVGGGQPWGGDLDVSWGALIVVSHGDMQGDEVKVGNTTFWAPMPLDKEIQSLDHAMATK